MQASFRPVSKTSLSDDLTERLLELVRTGEYQPGDRLPAIMHMAKSFGVSHPTLREALRKLEVTGVVEIKHGSGVYVRRGHEMMLVSNPTYGGAVSKKLLVDLIEARIPIERQAIALAAEHATAEHLAHMEDLLEKAAANYDDDVKLSAANMAFHGEIAAASGNTVLAQMQEVLAQLFQQEQRLILDIYGSRQQDHDEHESLLEAVRLGDPGLAETRMVDHLGGVRDAILQWDPDQNPLS